MIRQGPPRVARRGRRRPTSRGVQPGMKATVVAAERRAAHRHGADGRADGRRRRRATASSTSTCRPAARRAPACSRAASSTSAAVERADPAAERGAAARRLQLRHAGRCRRQGRRAQGRRPAAASATASRSSPGSPPTRASSPRAAASSPTATGARRRRAAEGRGGGVAALAPAPPHALPSASRHGHQRLPLVDPEPGAGGAAVHHADDPRPDELPGDEDPELPGHRPADDHHDGVAARRVAGAARDRGGAQDRELDRDAAGRQAHLHQGAGRHRDDLDRVPPREADPGGARRRARRGAADPLRPARRPARPGDHEDGARRRADPHLHGVVDRGWTTRRCRGSSTTTSPRRCWRCAASARWRGSAASRARSASSSTRRKLLALNATASDVSRQLRSIQQEASGGRTDVGGSEQSVRTIATVQSAEQLARLEIALADGRRIRLVGRRRPSATRPPSSAAPRS